MRSEEAYEDRNKAAALRFPLVNKPEASMFEAAQFATFSIQNYCS